jgi:AcrR family transcriptional regulator
MDGVLEAKAAVVRQAVVAGAVELMTAGEDLTFARVAAASGVAERTVYRYFENRAALLEAVVTWLNSEIAPSGARPHTTNEVRPFVRKVFTAFDQHAPLVRMLMREKDGLTARLADNSARQAAAMDLVRDACPGLDGTAARKTAAIVQLLSGAATWQSLVDYWGMSGAQAADTAANAIEAVLYAANNPSPKPPPTARSRQREESRS